MVQCWLWALDLYLQVEGNDPCLLQAQPHSCAMLLYRIEVTVIAGMMSNVPAGCEANFEAFLVQRHRHDMCATNWMLHTHVSGFLLSASHCRYQLHVT